jgi:1-Cys peroxiredoxin 6
MPAPLLGEVVPDFEADTTHGPIKLHEYIDGSWAILFSHPADYTPVCTTELGEVGRLQEEFTKRGVKVLALSSNDVSSHKGWISDIEAYTPNSKVDYPIISDPTKDIATLYGGLDPDEKDKAGLPLSARAVFVVGPDKKLKLSILYPATTGRNFTEILRVIDSLQLTAKHSVATPVNWKHGQDVVVVPGLSDDQAHAKFGTFKKAELPSGKGYLRTTADPTK